MTPERLQAFKAIPHIDWIMNGEDIVHTFEGRSSMSCFVELKQRNPDTGKPWYMYVLTDNIDIAPEIFQKAIDYIRNYHFSQKLLKSRVGKNTKAYLPMPDDYEKQMEEFGIHDL